MITIYIHNNVLEKNSETVNITQKMVRDVHKNGFKIQVSSPTTKDSPPGGLEPPTFRLTAERASQLRHGGSYFLEETVKKSKC
jgi:hypothetical protein